MKIKKHFDELYYATIQYLQSHFERTKKSEITSRTIGNL